MANYLPYQSTKVSVQQSVTEVSGLLSDAGFDQTAILNDKGAYSVIANYKSASFEFKSDENIIRNKLTDKLGIQVKRSMRFNQNYKDKKMEEIAGQAKRVAWRLMMNHIKTVCDSIKLGILTPAEAFAGNLRLKDTDGNNYILAESLTKMVESGELSSPAKLLGME